MTICANFGLHPSRSGTLRKVEYSPTLVDFAPKLDIAWAGLKPRRFRPTCARTATPTMWAAACPAAIATRLRPTLLHGLAQRLAQAQPHALNGDGLADILRSRQQEPRAIQEVRRHGGCVARGRPELDAPGSDLDLSRHCACTALVPHAHVSWTLLVLHWCCAGAVLVLHWYCAGTTPVVHRCCSGVACVCLHDH